MNKKLNISDQEIKGTLLRVKAEMDKFSNKHILNTNDPLVLVLKTHLYIENLLNQILSLILPFSDKLLKQRFLVKLDFLESLEPLPRKKSMIDKIRILNKIRNGFAHDLEKELDEKDITQLSEGFDIGQNEKSIEKFKMASSHILGYLHVVRSAYDLFPFILSIASNGEIYKRDKGFHRDEVIATYPTEDFFAVLDKMRLEV